MISGGVEDGKIVQIRLIFKVKFGDDPLYGFSLLKTDILACVFFSSKFLITSCLISQETC